MTIEQLNQSIANEKAHIDRLEFEKKEIKAKIDKLEAMEREFCQITDKKEAPIEFEFAIRELKESFNQCVDIIDGCKKEINACLAEKRRRTKSEKIKEAIATGKAALDEQMKTGKWEATCPYKEKYLQKAFRQGAFEDGAWPVRFIA